MMKLKKSLVAVSLLTVLSACDGDDGTNGFNSLINQTKIGGGAQCTFGGVRVDSGLDANADGTLDAGEINSTNYLCEENGFWLQLLHFADIDGNEATALESVDEFSALVDGFRKDDRYGLDTLVVSSGDNVIAGPRWFAAENSAVRAVTGSNEPGHVDHLWMNEFGVDATALGNHDLDQGPGELVDATSSESRDGVTFPGTKFPYLAANVDFSADSDFEGIIGQDGDEAISLGRKFAGSAIVKLGGERVGIVGASTPDLPNITSTGDLTIAGSTEEVAQLAAALQPTIDALTGAGIDKIVVVAHMQQISIEKALAKALKGVDIIVAGGSNTRMGDSTDALFPGDTEFAEDYPFQTSDADGNPTLVVNVDGDYKYLGRLVVAFDNAGHIIPSLLDKKLNGSWASTQANIDEVNGVRNARVVETRDALLGVISSQFNNVIGHTDVYLEGRRGEVRTQETNLGNFTSDAMIAYAEQCTELSNVLALRNGGGIRAEIGDAVTTGLETTFFPPRNFGLDTAKEGDVSEGHLRSTLRFDNGLVVVDVTGTQLKALLEHAVAATATGVTPGQFPQVGGISFGFDPVLAAGSRVTDLWVDTDDDNMPDTALYTAGVAQSAATDTYQVVTLNFLANGGDAYPFATQSSNRRQLYSSVGFGDPDAGDDKVPDFPVLSSCDAGAQSDFSYTGGEQDAVAEYFKANFADAGNGFKVADTAPADDRRIQNLSVISSFVAPVMP